MREPEAGSEFAIGAAAAGEARCPGFGVTKCHILRDRANLGRAQGHSLSAHVQYPSYSRRGPKAEECSGQQRG